MPTSSTLKKTALALSFTLLSACNAGSGDSEGAGGTSQPVSRIACEDVSLSNPEMIQGVFADQSVLSVFESLLETLLNPALQTQSGISDNLSSLSAISTSNFCELELFIFNLIEQDETGVFAPVTSVLNMILVGLKQGVPPSQLADVVSKLLGMASLVIVEDTNSNGLIDSALNLTNNLLGNGSILAPLNGLLNALLSPSTGALAPLTGLLNNLTDTQSGPLGPLTSLVDTLVNEKDEALEPVIALLNSILGGIEAGQTDEEIADGIDGLSALANGQLFVKNILIRLPFVGNELAKAAPVMAPSSVVPASSPAPTTTSSPLASIPIIGGLLEGLLGGLLGGLGGLGS